MTGDTPAEATDPAAAARTICLRLLTARPRSRAELATALRRTGVPDDVADAALDRLGDVGLVDDAAFAELTVHSGHTYRGLGRRALGAELRKRGVPDEIARDAVAAMEPADEERRARELVQRKLHSTTVSDEATVVRRIVGMLARKGYPEGLGVVRV
ncbi:MAG: recombination regulator RecX, partial [Actinobacteria bacterium]|nr:recombination regulator RecX [Actinomycetota bacterium]